MVAHEGALSQTCVLFSCHLLLTILLIVDVLVHVDVLRCIIPIETLHVLVRGLRSEAAMQCFLLLPRSVVLSVLALTVWYRDHLLGYQIELASQIAHLLPQKDNVVI